MSETVKILTPSDVVGTLWNAMFESTNDFDMLTKFGITPDGDNTEVEVKVTVNGVEVPFMETMSSVFAEFDDHVHARAKELVEDYIRSQTWRDLQDKVRDIDDALEDLNRGVQSELEKLWSKS